MKLRAPLVIAKAYQTLLATILKTTHERAGHRSLFFPLQLHELFVIVVARNVHI